MQRGIPELEQQPLLRVHRRRLGRRDAEAAVIEALGAAHEATVTHTRGVWSQGGRLLRRIPSCPRYLGNSVCSAEGTVPKRPRRQYSAAIGRTHGVLHFQANNGSTECCLAALAYPMCVTVQRSYKLPDCGQIEDQHARQRLSCSLLQLIAQLHCAKGINTRIHEGRVDVARLTGSALNETKHRGNVKGRCGMR